MAREKESIRAEPDGAVLVQQRRAVAGPEGDEEDLLAHARRYFEAAARSAERRRMHLLVKLGLDYLKLAAQMERARSRRRREQGAN
jgi:hypothetical protein